MAESVWNDFDEIDDDTDPNSRFLCDADAIFVLFEELCLAKEVTQENVFRALYYLVRTHGMHKVAFEMEDLGPDHIL